MGEEGVDDEWVTNEEGGSYVGRYVRPTKGIMNICTNNLTY